MSNIKIEKGIPLASSCKDIEVTEAMIAAGVSALDELDMGPSRSSLVERVFRAMIHAREPQE